MDLLERLFEYDLFIKGVVLGSATSTLIMWNVNDKREKVFVSMVVIFCLLVGFGFIEGSVKQ